MQDTKEKQSETSKKLTAHPYFPIVTLAGVGVIVAGIWFAGFSEGSRHASSKDNPFATSAGKSGGFSWGGASDWAKNFLSQNFPWAASSSWADRSAGSDVSGNRKSRGIDDLDNRPENSSDHGYSGQASARYGSAAGGSLGYGVASGGGAGGAGAGAGGSGREGYSASASARRSSGADGRGGAYGRGLGSGSHSALGGTTLLGGQQNSNLELGNSEETGLGSKSSVATNNQNKKGGEEARRIVAFKDEIRAVYDRTSDSQKKLTSNLVLNTLRDLQIQQKLQAEIVAPRVKERAGQVSSGIDSSKSYLTNIASKFKLPLGHVRRLDNLSKDLDAKLKSLDDLKRESDAARSLTVGLIARIEKKNIGADGLAKLRDESSRAHSGMEEGFKEYAAKEKEFIALSQKYDQESNGDRTLIAGEAKVHVDKASAQKLIAENQQAIITKANDDKIPILGTHLPYHRQQLAGCGNNAGGCAYWQDWINKDMAELARLDTLINNADAELKKAVQSADQENKMVAELNDGFNTVNSSVGGLYATAKGFQITQAERNAAAGQNSDSFASQFTPSKSASEPGSAAARAKGALSVGAALDQISGDFFTPEPGHTASDDVTLKLPMADLKKLNALNSQAKEEMGSAANSFNLAQEDARLGRSDALSLSAASSELVKSFSTVGKSLEQLAELEKEAPARIVR